MTLLVMTLVMTDAHTHQLTKYCFNYIQRMMLWSHGWLTQWP